MNPDINERQTLIRGLGLAAAISVIIANVIGTGVFVKARVMTCNVGEPTWVIVAWIAAGEKPKERWRIGTEHEKFVFRTCCLTP
ncbi:MAG: hypothetical protein ABL952_11350, partial [Pyrinomonadaceae bacterium]